MVDRLGKERREEELLQTREGGGEGGRGKE
jgi:hypothetical protein